MRERGETGSVLTLLCDPGDRYTDTYFDDDWVAAQGWELQPWREVLEAALPFDDRAASHRGRRGGALQPPSGPGPLRTTLAR